MSLCHNGTSGVSDVRHSTDAWTKGTMGETQWKDCLKKKTISVSFK